MAVYLHLFHGRNSPDEELDDWGFDGPVIGPLQHVHVTYMTDLKFCHEDGREDGLAYTGDLVTHEGKFYGDWSVTSELPVEKEDD